MVLELTDIVGQCVTLHSTRSAAVFIPDLPRFFGPQLVF